MATSPTPPSPTATWRNRIIGSGEEAPDQLLANPANWRIHPKAQQDALAGALPAQPAVLTPDASRPTLYEIRGTGRFPST